MAKYFQTPFASDGDKAEITDLPQSDGTVSYQAGYGVGYETNPAANGGRFMFVERSQMNGLLNEITGNLKAWQEKGYYTYNPAIKYGIGGRCNYDDGTGLKAYISTVPNNTRVPSTNGAVQSGWILGEIQKATEAEALAGTGSNMMTPELVKTAMKQFGLFGYAPNLNVNDLNNLTQNGFYNTSTTELNLPVAGVHYTVIVIFAHALTGLQIAIRIAGIETPLLIYYRRCQGGNWSAWQSLGNKGINTRSTPIQISWDTNYTVPVNGTIRANANNNFNRSNLMIFVDGLCVLENHAPPSTYLLNLFSHLPIRAGQTVFVTGSAPGDRLILFYPD